MLWPAHVLRARVELIPDDHGEKLLTTPHDFPPFQWKPTRTGAVYPDNQGTAVWTRPDHARAIHAEAMRRGGIRVVAETDDNYLSDPKLNIFMRHNDYRREQQQLHLQAMASFDAIVTTTKWLRDTYAKTMRDWLGLKRNELPEFHICGNHIPDDQWPQVEPYDGPLRIGWMGSPQHYRDVQLAYPVFFWAKEQGYETTLIGQSLWDEDGVTKQRALDNCRAWRSVITKHIPWIDPSSYHHTALPLDIGLIPLERNHHTYGKSDVKAVEYVASGAVPVISRHPVYTENWKHEETCLFASSPADFVVQVARLVRDPGLRKGILEAATEYVFNERGSDAIRREWQPALADA